MGGRQEGRSKKFCGHWPVMSSWGCWKGLELKLMPGDSGGVMSMLLQWHVEGRLFSMVV